MGRQARGSDQADAFPAPASRALNEDGRSPTGIGGAGARLLPDQASKPLGKTDGSGTATASDGVSHRRLWRWLLMLVVVRAAGTGHLLTVEGAVELYDRPRAVSVRWGHERLVGCRALEPCH
jgi:hypothetical protein